MTDFFDRIEKIKIGSLFVRSKLGVTKKVENWCLCITVSHTKTITKNQNHFFLFFFSRFVLPKALSPIFSTDN